MPLTLLAIDVGHVPGDRTGNPARVAFQKINTNFALVAGAVIDAEVKSFGFALTDENETIIDRLAILGDDVMMTHRWPYSFYITGIRASLKIEDSGDDVVLDILADGVSILDSNKLIIPAGSKTSYGQISEPVVESAILVDDSEITIEHVSSPGGGVAAGLKVSIIGYLVVTE